MDSTCKISIYYVLRSFQVLLVILDYLIVSLWVEAQKKTIQ
jgi:hypothetical protein